MTIRFALLAPIALTCSTALARVDTGPQLLKHARVLIGVDYDFGGRMQSGRGVDCQGIIFYAAERMQRCDWRSFSVMPSQAIPAGELGTPVFETVAVSTSALRVESLRAGDVLWLVGPIENPVETPSAHLDGEPQWVWHTALYAGEGRMLHADPFAGTVHEEDLVAFLMQHRGLYAGLIATRLDGDKRPAPMKCRRGRRMVRPRAA